MMVAKSATWSYLKRAWDNDLTFERASRSLAKTGSLAFLDVFRGSKNRYQNNTQKVTKIVSNRDPKSKPKSPKWAPKVIRKQCSKKASKNDHFQHP